MVKSMIRKLAVLLAALLLLVLCALPALAEPPMVVDDAILFNQNQIDQMETIITRIRSKYQMDVVILTTRSTPVTTDDRRLAAFADDYYDYNGYGLGTERHGLLFMIDMNNRYTYISTRGDMILYINDSREEELLDAAYEYLSSNRGKGTIAFLQKLEELLADGIEEGTFVYDEVTGKRISGLYNKLTQDELILSLIAGLIAFFVPFASVHGAYNLKGKTYRYDVNANASRLLTVDSHRFIREKVTRTTTPPPSSGGGGHGSSGGGRGSGVHVSSSGASHGGGGRHF